MIAGRDTGALASHLIHCLVALPTASAMMGSHEFDSKESVDAHFRRIWEWLINGVRA